MFYDDTVTFVTVMMPNNLRSTNMKVLLAILSANVQKK